jgi:hypothetical protein
MPRISSEKLQTKIWFTVMDSIVVFMRSKKQYIMVVHWKVLLSVTDSKIDCRPPTEYGPKTATKTMIRVSYMFF